MVEKLCNVDPNLLTLDCAEGTILVSNHLQGRIFVAFGRELAHRFLDELAANPDPVEFNNLGGNSLWPAPEGGDFAFNYPPGGEWRVQEGINSVKTATVEADSRKIVVSKKISLENRKGKTIDLEFRRTVTPLAENELPGSDYQVARTGYHTVDELIPLGKYSTEDVLISAWSLEQFPGASGITAFGRCLKAAKGCINDDFYGDPSDRIAYRGDLFRFELGGEKRLQVGIKAANQPALIGAMDWKRGFLTVRTTPLRKDGRYINIADNDQASGPYGAADMFSIFNGADELNFHELETIAPMESDAEGNLLPSRLESTTFICKGNEDDLRECLAGFFGVLL